MKELLKKTGKNTQVGIASPNPNYEQKVKCVTGENTVRVRGKNLLNTLNLFVYEYKGVTYTPVYENGKLLYIDVNGTATEISFMSIQILLKPNSKYYISGCPLNGSNDTYKDMILDSIYYTSSANDFGNGVSLRTGSKTSWQYRIRINAGYTCNHLKFYPMIEESSENQTEPSEYEPYYKPQEKELDLESYNKFDKNNANIINAYINSVNKVIESNDNARTIIFPCKPNTTYTTSKIASQRFIIGTAENYTIGTICSTMSADFTATKKTVTTTQNDHYLIIYFYLSTVDTLTEQEILNSIQIVEGSTEKPYQAYYHYEVYESGYFSRENGKWYLNNVYEKFNLLSTLNWLTSNNGYWFYTYSFSSISNASNSNIKSNFFNKGFWHDTTDRQTQNIIAQGNGSSSIIGITTATFSTIADLKTFLDNNNVYAIATLLTPSKTEITNQTLINQLNDIYKLMSYDGTTIIETECEEGNMPIIISASALLDSAKVIEDLETRIEVLESEE